MSVPVADPGLQPERTSMAWGRTSLAYLVAAAIMLRWAPHYGAVVVLAAGGLALVASGIHGTQRRRYHRAVRGMHRERLGVSAGAVVGLTVGTVVLGLLGMCFVLADARG